MMINMTIGADEAEYVLWNYVVYHTVWDSVGGPLKSVISLAIHWAKTIERWSKCCWMDKCWSIGKNHSHENSNQSYPDREKQWVAEDFHIYWTLVHLWMRPHVLFFEPLSWSLCRWPVTWTSAQWPAHESEVSVGFGECLTEFQLGEVTFVRLPVLH